MLKLIVNLSTIFALCFFSCLAKATDHSSGKQKLHYQKYTPNQTTLIHVLTIDPKKLKIVAVRAQETGQGLDTVDNIAKHMGAIAAINGGFFRVNLQTENQGIPAGILKINQHWHGIAYKPRGAIAWNPATGLALIDRVQTDSAVLIRQQSLPINAMNKLANGNKASLLSDCYTDPIDIKDSLGIIIANQKVQAIYTAGNIQIPEHAYLFNLSGDLRTKIKSLKFNDPAQIKIQVHPQLNTSNAKQWNQEPYIVGGGPLLIHNNKKITDFSSEGMYNDFIENKYARTAVGILPDKRWVLVVAERGLFPETEGLSIPELRDFMASLGCVYAVNLDGGGSSAMYVDGFINANMLSQPVADAIVILER